MNDLWRPEIMAAEKLLENAEVALDAACRYGSTDKSHVIALALMSLAQSAIVIASMRAEREKAG